MTDYISRSVNNIFNSIHNKNAQSHRIKTIDQFKEISKGNNQLKILHENIRSTEKNCDEFSSFLGLFDNVFDVIVLTETHLIWN